MLARNGERIGRGDLHEWPHDGVGFWSVHVLPVFLPFIRPFPSDFTQKCLTAPNEAASNTTVPMLHANSVPLLKVWAKAKLALGSWQDALTSAVSVSVPVALASAMGLTRCWVTVHSPQSDHLPGHM